MTGREDGLPEPCRHMEKDPFMLAALSEARMALEENEVPVGAVIVKDGEIVGAGHNRRIRKQDPTAHAEIEAIRDACTRLNDWRLSGCEMYVTLEPCIMCAGAIVQSRISRVYFGAFDRDFGCAGSKVNLPQDRRIGGNCIALGGLLQEECSALLSSYFRQLR